MEDLLDRAIVARIPVLIKARAESSGRRIVDVEASTEEKDADGDCVMQSALIGSAASFIATGHLDLDHKSELGHRMNPPIPDPSSYIVGRPLDVRAAPGGRTFVEGEISRSADGTDDPSRSQADMLWASLRRDPPVVWYASIYGYPVDLEDCSRGQCSSTKATRFVIKAIDWRSLALTRTPKNTALSSPARIITAKAFLANLAKADPPTAAELAIPNTMDDVYAAADCLGCRPDNLLGFKSHFAKCEGYPDGTADILAHAAMHRRNMGLAMKRFGLDYEFKRNKDGVMK